MFRARAAVSRGLRGARGLCSRIGRDDGFHEGLPRGDVVAPIFFASLYAATWFGADDGWVKSLIDKAPPPHTDPEKNPTPYQIFHNLWPHVAGCFGTLFDSVACKFTRTSDMEWLCTEALNDDTNAAVALSLLTPPSENSTAFVRAIFDKRPDALRRTQEIVQVCCVVDEAFHCTYEAPRTQQASPSPSLPPSLPPSLSAPHAPLATHTRPARAPTF
jgi:hypothetical protein